MTPDPGNHTTDEDDEAPPEDMTVPELRGAIRAQIGREPRATALRRDEVVAVYEAVAGRRFPEDASVPEGRYRIIDNIGGLENRNQFDSSYPFRHAELLGIYNALREAGIREEVVRDADDSGTNATPDEAPPAETDETDDETDSHE